MTSPAPARTGCSAGTPLSRELGPTVTVSEVGPLVERRLAALSGAEAVAHAPLALPTAAVTTSSDGPSDGLETGRSQKALLITPPSTRNAAPVVADARGLAR